MALSADLISSAPGHARVLHAARAPRCWRPARGAGRDLTGHRLGGNEVTGGDAGALRVQLLGPVRAWRGEQELELGGPRRRAVLGMLAMRVNQVVSRSELIDGMWGENPPASAVNSVHVYVAGLRRVLEPRRAHRAPGQVLPASGPGYLLRLGPGQVDAETLDHHLTQAQRSPATGDLAAAARSLNAPRAGGAAVLARQYRQRRLRSLSFPGGKPVAADRVAGRRPAGSRRAAPPRPPSWPQAG